MPVVQCGGRLIPRMCTDVSILAIKARQVPMEQESSTAGNSECQYILTLFRYDVKFQMHVVKV